MSEYIDREEFIQHIEESDLPDTAKRAVIALVRHMPAADVVEVFRGKDSVLSEFENDYKDFKKIKTHLAQIIVEDEVEKPYFSILWFDEENKEYYVGYSSYCLDYVRKWLELVFDVVDTTAADVVHGEWISHEGYDECNLCHAKSIYGHNYCPNCGAKMDGGRKGTE